MSRLIQPGEEIETLKRQKQAVEQELAGRLYRAFDTGAAIANLRTVVLRGLIHMRNGERKAIAGALHEERFLDVMSRHAPDWPDWPDWPDTVEKIDKLIKEIDHFNASDCSDVIRLLGAYTEHSRDVLELQQAYRGGVLPREPETAAIGWAGERWEEEAAAVWAQGNRDRGRTDEMGLPFAADQRGPATTSGMSLKRAWRWSNVLKMDRLFGLLVGADISGTTADSTFAVERWGSDVLASAYYLLPAATIVFNLHHTLLEVALVLSLNDVIDYRVGFYNTLLPGVANEVPPELADVVQALGEAETNDHNQHFLIFYTSDSHAPAGCIHFEPDEIGLLRDADLSRATTLLSQLQNSPQYPTQAKVVELIKRKAPALYPGLPLELRTTPGHRTA